MIDRPRSLFHAIEVWGHDMDFEPLRIPQPTAARPGSEEKVRILQARLEAGEDLYHFGDAKIAASLELQNALAAFVRKSALDLREEN